MSLNTRPWEQRRAVEAGDAMDVGDDDSGTVSRKRMGTEVWSVDCLRENLCDESRPDDGRKSKRRIVGGSPFVNEQEQEWRTSLPPLPSTAGPRGLLMLEYNPRSQGPATQTTGEYQPPPGYMETDLGQSLSVNVRRLDGKLLHLKFSHFSLDRRIPVHLILEDLEEKTMTPRSAIRLIANSISLKETDSVTNGSTLYMVEQFGTQGHPERFRHVM